MMKKLRLPLDNGKYTYIYAKAKFTDRVEIHLVDRLKPKSSISILESIYEIQEQILKHVGIEDNVLLFLKDSKWILYGKEGEIYEYLYGELFEINSNFHPILDREIMVEEIYPRLPYTTSDCYENVEQLYLF